MQTTQISQTISLTDWNIAKNAFWEYAKIRSKKEGMRKYTIDETNRVQIASFVSYFSNFGEVMNQNNINPNKSLLLAGTVGSGKSFLFRVLNDCCNDENVKHLFSRVKNYKCTDVTCDYMAEDEKGIEKYGLYAVKREMGVINKYHALFDDLGFEEVCNRYGNKRDVMIDVINDRYEYFLEYGLKTHFTTNLLIGQIEARYGARIVSRLKQMCNVINMEGDFR